MEIPFNNYFRTYEKLYSIQVEKQEVPLDLFDSGILEPEMTANDSIAEEINPDARFLWGAGPIVWNSLSLIALMGDLEAMTGDCIIFEFAAK